jgi:fatty acid desaturase
MWGVAHGALVAAAWVALVTLTPGTLLSLLLSLVVGHSFAGLAFVAHEVLHGSMVRGRRAMLLVGGLAFLPFMLSPRLWIAWHNRVHHGHTTERGVDPDSFPTLAEYRQSRRLRVSDRVAFGSRRLLGLSTLLLGFTGQSLSVLFGAARRHGYLSKTQYRLALLETALAAAGWALLGITLGIAPFVYGYLLPLLVANCVVMSYILTNHSLSPLTSVNDPLLNSLSVTTCRAVDVLHLSFGYHVEHHLFPAMSPRHARRVRTAVTRLWPERYQSMSLLAALRRLWETPRVYASSTLLVEPETGRTWPTLEPRSKR